MLAIRTLLGSRPDGSTLLAAVGSTLVHNPALRKHLPYDPLKDFTLLGLAVTKPCGNSHQSRVAGAFPRGTRCLLRRPSR